MWDIILFVYLLGILLSQPVYIWAIGTLCRMEDEDEELYCQDNGLYYEPRKPNYPLVMVLMVLAGIFWPLVILFAIFLPLTFILMDKMGSCILRRTKSWIRKRTRTYNWVGRNPHSLRWRKLWQLYETPIQTHYLMV